MTQNKSPVQPTMNSADEPDETMADIISGWGNFLDDLALHLETSDPSGFKELCDAVERGELLKQGKQEADD